MRRVKIGAILGCLLVGMYDQPALGDGGTVRLLQCQGNYRLSVFTAPTPFRAGPVDISVLVQDVVTGDIVPEAQITVCVMPHDWPGQPMRQVATSGAATNKLLKAAVFDLPQPGRWDVDVAISGRAGAAHVRFEMTAAGRIPQWPAMWPWISWPAPVVLLFSIHQLLVWRRCAAGLERLIGNVIFIGVHCRGTGVPHSRQMAAPRWTGFLQRGQTRRPASNLTAEAGGDIGGTKPTSASGSAPATIAWRPVVVETGASGRDWDWLRVANPIPQVAPGQWRQVLRFVLRCHSPRLVSTTRLSNVACAEVGTGTTRPQSGHLPATGRSLAETFSRRPQGQRNRRKPSPPSLHGWWQS